MRQCGTLDTPVSCAMIPANHYGATMNKNSASRAGDIRVDVIGAGRSGILTGIRLLQAYRGLAVPKFPNFFMLIGPNSPIGNLSLGLIAEMQVDYILKLIARIRDQQCRALAPTVAATRAFNTDIREAMKHTVWVSGCRSWYLDKNGTPVTWPWSFERFQDDMRAPNLTEFEMRI